MGEVLGGLNILLLLIVLSFGVRTWALTSILVLFEVGWVILITFIALWSTCIEDTSLLFMGITLLYISTVELAVGVTIFLLLNAGQGQASLGA